MEKFELEEGLKEEIRARVLGDGFMKLVQTVRRNGKQFKIAMRPVEIGGVRKYQAEMTDDRDVRAKNFDANGAAEGLEEIIAQKGARDLHLMTAKGDLHVRVTKKGHVLVSRSAEMDRVVVVKPHDRVKNVPLAQFDSAMLLKVIGLADGEGKVRASMRGKYDQVNEFLKVVGETVTESSNHQPRTTNHEPPTTNHDAPFTVVDCGCGKAYLTIALWFYLTEVLKIPEVRVIGVDRRADVIASAKKMAAQLDLSGKVDFIEADLSELSDLPQNQTIKQSNNQTIPSHVDMVVSLHACDTATDEALAKGVEWKAKYILSAPCCQHELQKAIGSGSQGVFSGLLRQSILRERLCDILTDAFRAMILRILGFKVQVIESVSSEATARNIMLKCEYGVKPGQAGPVAEYLDLREYWKVTPWLETRLSAILGKHLSRYA
jgi:hypothetical protein